MKVRLPQLQPLTASLFQCNQDMEHFRVAYNHITFDVVYDVSQVPYELLIGAVGHQWASVVQLERGYNASMPDNDFYALCDLLELRPGRGVFTSVIFLQYIANHAPTACHPHIVPINVIRQARPVAPDSDGVVRDIFCGWNDHLQDGKVARNFDKTEKYFGAHVAEYCREHNISSRWTYDHGQEVNPHYPSGYHQI